MPKETHFEQVPVELVKKIATIDDVPKAEKKPKASKKDKVVKIISEE